MIYYSIEETVEYMTIFTINVLNIMHIYVNVIRICGLQKVLYIADCSEMFGQKVRAILMRMCAAFSGQTFVHHN